MIANIVSHNKVNVSKEFNVVNNIDDIINGLPTLLIGFDYVNKNYPDFDITSIMIEKDLYWTFKRTEKRDKYDEDLFWFISKVYADLTQDISYVFVDPIQYRKQTFKKIIKKIYNLNEIISYVHDDMIYIYGEKLLFGIDLKLLKYVGVDTIKIKNKIKRISNEFLEDNKILIEYKNNIEALGNQVRYIPYLYTINNEQNNTTSFIHISRTH